MLYYDVTRNDNCSLVFVLALDVFSSIYTQISSFSSEVHLKWKPKLSITESHFFSHPTTEQSFTAVCTHTDSYVILPVKQSKGKANEMPQYMRFCINLVHKYFMTSKWVEAPLQ